MYAGAVGRDFHTMALLSSILKHKTVVSLLENILARDEFNLHYTFNSVSLTDPHKNSGIHRLADCIARCLQEPHTAFPQGAMVYSLVLADLVFTGDFMKTTKNYRN